MPRHYQSCRCDLFQSAINKPFIGQSQEIHEANPMKPEQQQKNITTLNLLDILYRNSHYIGKLKFLYRERSARRTHKALLSLFMFYQLEIL